MHIRSSLFTGFVFLILVAVNTPLASQVTGQIPDTLNQISGDTISGFSYMDVLFSGNEAIEYLEALYDSKNWKDENDPFRLYIGHLILQARSAHQSRIAEFMNAYPFEHIKVPAESFFRSDTIRIALPDIRSIDTIETRDYSFIGGYTLSARDTRFLKEMISSIDSVLGIKDTTEVGIDYDDITDSLQIDVADTIAITDTIGVVHDSLRVIDDTSRIIPVEVAVMPDSLIVARDSALLDIVAFLDDSLIVAPDTVMGADTLITEVQDQERRKLKQLGSNLFLDGDTVLLVIEDTLKQVFITDPEFPFLFYDNPFKGDSIQSAISGLMDILEKRDSTVVYFTGLSGEVVPLWLNTEARSVTRFWLPNEFDDSVTVWVGNPYRNTVGLYLENNIQFRRPSRTTTFGEANIRPMPTERRTLGEVQTVYVKPDYWRYHADVSLMINQTYLSNWAKGGESSISGSVDIRGNANYLNDDKDIEFTNSARIRHGLVYAEEKGVRRNVDRVEISSKLNFEAFGQFDFSSTAHFQTQFAKGYRYPNDSIPVSRFLNPAEFSVGTGLDYKPNRETSINLSPLSYKVRFMTDTASFNQRRHGIDEDKKARHELGATLQARYRFDIFDNIRISNTLKLFSNYIEKPKNIDIDWEMTLTTSLNWFTDIRINTHLVYDDDVTTAIEDDEGNPVLGDDGKQLRQPRIQFREVIGFTLIFRF